MTRRNLGTESIWVLALNAVQVLVVAVGFIRAANVLGPAAFGIFTFAYTVGGFAPLISGLGGDQVLLMKASREPGTLDQLLSNATIIRVLLSLLGVAGLLAFGAAWGWRDMDVLGYATGGAVLGAFCFPLFASAFRVRGEFLRPGTYSIAGNLLFVTVLYAFPGQIDSAARVAALYLAGQALSAVLSAADLSRHVRWSPSVALWRRDATLGVTFAVSQVVDLAFQRMDIIILRMLATAAAVGAYSAGYRIVGALLALPAAAQVVLLPEFHRQAADAGQLDRLFRTFRGVLMELCVLVFGGVVVLSERITDLLFTSMYHETTGVVRASCLGVSLAFLAYPYSMLAEASGLVGNRLRWRLVSLAVGAAACAVAIPSWHAVGAAWGVAAGSAAFLLQLHWAMRRRVESMASVLREATALVPGVAAGAIVVLGARWLGHGLVGLLAAGSAYTALFVGLGALLRCCTYLRPAAMLRLLQQLLRPGPAIPE